MYSYHHEPVMNFVKNKFCIRIPVFLNFVFFTDVLETYKQEIFNFYLSKVPTTSIFVQKPLLKLKIESFFRLLLENTYTKNKPFFFI